MKWYRIAECIYVGWIIASIAYRVDSDMAHAINGLVLITFPILLVISMRKG